MKLTFILFLLFSCSVYAQSDSLPDLFIRYSEDPSIVIVGYEKPAFKEINIDSVESYKIVDTLIYKYTLDFGFYADSIQSDRVFKQLVLDSTTFSKLLIRSKLIMSQVKYGYAGAENNEKLTEKYGVMYFAGGCIYNPHEIELQYSRYMWRLLNIRNGNGWAEDYRKDLKKMK